MRRAWLRPALGIGALLALFGLVGGGWWFSAERKYQGDLQRIRSLGYATSLAELDSEEGGDNALDLYQKVGTQFNAVVGSGSAASYDEFRYMRGEEWSGSAFPGFASSFKSKFGHLTASLAPALHMPARWSLRYRENFSGTTAIRLQSGLAVAEVRDGNFSKALEAFELLCKMTSDFLATPYALQYNTADYGALQELEVLKILLPAIANDRSSLKRLDEILNHLPPVPSFEGPMRDEIARVLDLTSDSEMLQKYMSEEIAKKVENDTMLPTAIGVRMLSRQAAAEIASILEKVPTDNWKSFDKYWTDTTSRFDAEMNASALNFIFYQELRWRTGAFYAKALTCRRLGSLATKVLLDRVQGKYPPDLASFGELAEDPFGGDVFRYVFGPSSMLIYSLDYNGVDDGGKVAESTPGASENSALDIVLQIPLSSQ